MKRILSFELVRIKTMRSSWLFPFIGAVIAWVASAMFVRTATPGVSIPFLSFVGNAYTPLSILFITIPAAQAFGHEYRDGTMRLTLSEFPKRTQVFFAKLLMPALVAFIWSVVTFAGIYVICMTGPVTGFDQLLPATLRFALYTVAWGLLVAAVTAITRNLAAGVAGILVWGLILEQLFGSMLSTKFPVLTNYLPIIQGLVWSSTGNVNSGLVLLATVIIIVGYAFIRFVKRDA